MDIALHDVGQWGDCTADTLNCILEAPWETDESISMAMRNIEPAWVCSQVHMRYQG